MSELLFTVTTAVLMLLLLRSAAALIDTSTIRRRRIPWFAVALTAVAVAGVVVQLSWAAAMDTLDHDPARAGWWRPITAVFMQNGGVVGVAFNLVTIAIVAALAEWFWGGPLMLVLFACGALLPHYVSEILIGPSSVSTDPRNFAGSSGATYFLAATLAAALVVRSRVRSDQLLALAAPVLGLVMWLVQGNGHGLVTVYGFVLGALALTVRRRVPLQRQEGVR